MWVSTYTNTLWQAYHVEEHCICEEGSSPKYAAVHGGFKISGCGCGDADDRFHGGIKVVK